MLHFWAYLRQANKPFGESVIEIKQEVYEVKRAERMQHKTVT